jgi:2-C-methyl-D-erythritol 4-phosphate cytidylyltransferase
MNGAVVVAAGRGTRLGAGLPKCLRSLGDKPLLFYSLETLATCSDVAAVVAVVPPAHAAELARTLPTVGWSNLTAVVPGGETRADSVLRGLAALPVEARLVAVHDAARPFATAQLFGDVFRAARRYGGAIAAAPTTDTLKQTRGDRITRTLDRAAIWRAQTPQVFDRVHLAEALTRETRDRAAITDEAQAMERAGHAVHIVSHTHLNLKISTPADWRFAEYWLSREA